MASPPSAANVENGTFAPLARPIAVATSAGRPPAFSAADLVWCALGPLRLHYTAFTGDVTSKHGAGEHGLTAAPPTFHEVLREALAARATGELGPATTEQMRVTVALTEWCIAEVAAAR